MTIGSKTSLTNLEGYRNVLGYRVDYRKAYGFSMDGVFKPFTTLMGSGNGWQMSMYNISGIAPSSIKFLGADSSGLNPLGPWTLSEGIIYGNTRPTGVNFSMEAGNARLFGLKTPQLLVGWGYDKFGYPAPNSSRTWAASGRFASTAPGTSFAATGAINVTRGSQVPPDAWLSGPMDLRWDGERRVWTGAQSVYAGRVRQSYRNLIPLTTTDLTTPYLAEEITYDVEIFDGIANPIRVTGIRPVNDRPEEYKVYAASSGRSCLILHAPNGNSQPDYSMWLNERPGTIECNGTATSDSTVQSLSSAFGGDSIFYSTLATDQLESTYGGTGFGTYSSGQILICTSGTTLQRLKLVTGSGFSITQSGSFLTMGLSSGVSFVNAGINTTITQLQGLTTPLTIAQGGTGASGKIFVDLNTQQSISASKNFSSGILIGLAASGINNIGFLGYFNTGFAVASGSIVKVNTSGSTVLSISPLSSAFTNVVDISPASSGTPCLSVREGYNPNNYDRYVTAWYDRYGSKLGHIDNYGALQASRLDVSGVISTGYVAAVHVQLASGYDGDAFRVKSFLNGTTFSINPTGHINMGPSGFNTRLAVSSGNKTINLPTNSGTLALIADVSYRNYAAVTGISTLNAANDIVETASGNYNIYLPLANNIRGRVYTFRNNGTASVGIAGSGSDLVNGTGVYSLSTNTTVNVISRGNGWMIY